MKKRFIILALFIAGFSFAQDNTTANRKGEWLASVSIGTAKTKLENTYVRNNQVILSSICKEFVLNNKYSLITGIEEQRLSFNTIDPILSNNAVVSNQFIKVPLSLRTSLINEKNTSLYGELTVYGSHLYVAKQESVATTTKERNIGTNFGYGFGFGLSQKIVDKISFNVGFIAQADFYQTYKKDFNKLKINELYAFRMGIGYTF